MRWFIDGYNVTRTDPATRKLSLEQQREALETRLRIKAANLLGSSDYAIIWDGAGGFTHSGPSGSGKKEQFTRLKTADDSIVGRVKRSQVRVGVVTSDRELMARCKSAASCGVDFKPSSVLFEATVPKKKKGPTIRRDVGLPSNANLITQELKELWKDELE